MLHFISGVTGVIHLFIQFISISFSSCNLAAAGLLELIITPTFCHLKGHCYSISLEPIKIQICCCPHFMAQLFTSRKNYSDIYGFTDFSLLYKFDRFCFNLSRRIFGQFCFILLWCTVLYLYKQRKSYNYIGYYLIYVPDWSSAK